MPSGALGKRWAWLARRRPDRGWYGESAYRTKDDKILLGTARASPSRAVLLALCLQGRCPVSSAVTVHFQSDRIAPVSAAEIRDPAGGCSAPGRSSTRTPLVSLGRGRTHAACRGRPSGQDT